MSDPAVPRPTFADGVVSLFGGVRFVVMTPSVWPLALVPMIAATVVTVILAVLAISHVPAAITTWLGPAASTFGTLGHGIVAFFATVLALVIALVLGFSLAQPLSGPALEAIVRRQEAVLGLAPRPPAGFVREVLHALQSLVIGLTLGLPPLALLLFLSLIFPAAAIVLVPLKILLASFIAAWDLCDYPMSLRGMPMRRRLALLFHHRGAVLGFGVGMALAGLVPPLAFVLLPAGVAGATRLMHRVERHKPQA